VDTKNPVTTIPFVKGHEFNYAKLLPAAFRDYAWILYILIVILLSPQFPMGPISLTVWMDWPPVLQPSSAPVLGFLLMQVAR
jgi:hypothetical protein